MKRQRTDAKNPARPPAGPKRIMLVDDHPLVSKGVAALLKSKSDLRLTAEAGSADEALRSLERDVPDLMLIDVSLPGMSGIELLKQLNTRYPSLRLLVLSMHEENVYAERALRAGAHGYIMKHEPGDKVIEAIRCVLRGETYISPSLSAQMIKRIMSDGKSKPNASAPADLSQLSDRELQVFTQIGSGVATREISEQLQLSVKTIQTYREHIKRKLGLRNATELVHYATQWVESSGTQARPAPGPTLAE